MMPSDRCQWTALLSARYAIADRDRYAVRLMAGWAGRWTATWRVDGGELVTPARDLGSVPVACCAPVRPFSWRTTQRHRPGLEFLVSTGRHHGFESIAEQRLLLMLDFADAVSEVLSQPLRLRFETLQAGGRMSPTSSW